MKYSISFMLMAIIAMGCLSFANHKNNIEMEAPVKKIVLEFSEAIAKQDVTALDVLLHQEFRVIANQYPKPEATTILPKTVYSKMMGDKNIGGSAYEVEFQHVHVDGHTATVIASFKGEKANMDLTLLLTQSKTGAWQIVTDLPIIKPNE